MLTKIKIVGEPKSSTIDEPDAERFPQESHLPRLAFLIGETLCKRNF